MHGPVPSRDGGPSRLTVHHLSPPACTGPPLWAELHEGPVWWKPREQLVGMGQSTSRPLSCLLLRAVEALPLTRTLCGKGKHGAHGPSVKGN